MQTQDTSPELILYKVWPWVERRKNELIGGLVVILLAAGVVFYLSSARAAKDVEAGEAVTAVVMNPAALGSGSQLASSLKVVADKYAGTAAADRAELQAAGALFDDGNYADAEAQFKKYLDTNPTGPLAATAAFGIAVSQEAQNKLDLAAASYQRVTSAFSTSQCVSPAEYALGRIAEQQNKLSEAVAHYQKAVAAATFGGTIRNQAMMRGQELQAKLAATAPKPAMMTTPVPGASAAPALVVPTQPAPSTPPAGKP
jgi:predicted negative regulator of RcsB-dependent stress response